MKPGDRTSWPTTLVSDKSRVYKGGSWKDRAYWLVASNRRYLDEDKATDAIGFRCAMDQSWFPYWIQLRKKKEKEVIFENILRKLSIRMAFLFYTSLY